LKLWEIGVFQPPIVDAHRSAAVHAVLAMTVPNVTPWLINTECTNCHTGFCWWRMLDVC